MDTGISDFWRKNTSNQESKELANLLRALRKVAGHLGENVGLIEYTGMSHGGQASIIIEADMVMGSYPVPGRKVDYLVGLVTHEALHKVEWSDHVWKLLEPAFKDLDPLPRIAFQKIVYVGEDIYVDFVAEQKVFRLYTAQSRKDALKERQAKLRRDVLSMDALVYLWWARTWNQDLGIEIDKAYRKPLNRLELLNEGLRIILRMKKGVIARCQERAQLYLDAWRSMEDSLASWDIIDKRLYWYPSSSGSDGTNDKSGSKKVQGKSSLPAELTLGIEEALAASTADLTPVIRSVVGEDNASVAPISRWDYSVGAHPVIDRRTVYRLKSIFQNYAGANKVVSRGLQSGRVDARRLYRAPITGRCFQQIDRLPSLDWSVTLLMDASGSMKGNKWRMVENTVANLHKALQGYQNRLQVFAYFEADGICMISQLIKENKLFSVPPNGQTASGQAIIAAAYLMDKRRPRNIMIHVTDGESNFGCDVQYGIDYCRRQNIHLVTLGCGYRDREAMERQYGKTIQFLNHYEQLPQAVERLLKWTFLYGTKPHLVGDKFLKLDDGFLAEKGNNSA